MPAPYHCILLVQCRFADLQPSSTCIFVQYSAAVMVASCLLLVLTAAAGLTFHAVLRIARITSVAPASQGQRKEDNGRYD
jgi:hypothetical protein